MDPVQQAFRSLMALIGMMGGMACFGFFAVVQPKTPGFALDLPGDLRVVRAVDRRPLVIVDAGHGGVDGGAAGSGLQEKNLTLGMARQLGVELERRGIRVIQTREEDRTLSLDARARLANRHPEALFVSVHFNTSPAKEVKGLETYYTSPKSLTAIAKVKRRFGIEAGTKLRDERGRLLAEKVQAAVVGETECRDRGARNRSLLVTRETSVPSILVECAYLTNATEAERLRSRAYRASLAKGIAEGVREYLDEADGSEDEFYGLVIEERAGEKDVASVVGE